MDAIVESKAILKTQAYAPKAAKAPRATWPIEWRAIGPWGFRIRRHSRPVHLSPSGGALAVL